jgi:NAD(P)-dependent dehydrogenase (short-subunit alcohol dehydrogenase family)
MRRHEASEGDARRGSSLHAFMNDEFVRVMVTNTLSPMRVVETLQEIVLPTGTIAVMSSGQGSVANNQNGNYEVYRGSKAALNMFMRSFAARHKDDPPNPAASGSGLGQN